MANFFLKLLKNNSLFFFLLFSFVCTAQQVSTDLSIVSTSENASQKFNNNKIEFAMWFMGTNQTPNFLIVPQSMSPKRTILISGSSPNRLLIESLLKKTVSFEYSLS